MDKFLSFDLGGTKLLGGWVSSQGEILSREKHMIQLDQGPDFLVEQISELAKRIKGNETPKLTTLASAGPLDPSRGLLLDPTNMKSQGESWGVYPLVERLQQNTGWAWKLENDAAAAALAEAWVGSAKDVGNSITITLGTGLGVGIIANGALVRSGRGLHPEAGHIIIEHIQKEALCGCGNYGCAEAYLSGKNFCKCLSQKWNEEISGEELLARAKANDQRAIEEFKSYGRRLAIFLASLVVLYAPEVIIIAGGFSHSSDLFLPETRRELESLLVRRRKGVDLLPKIQLSEFRSAAGLLGSARVTQLALN